MSNTDWIASFCVEYSPLALSAARLFIYLGLITGLLLAAAEVYKVYRKARAIAPAAGGPLAAPPAPTPVVGEIIKNLTGLLTGARAWLALVILGVVLWWLAGNAAPPVCTSPQGHPASQQQRADQLQRQQSGAPTNNSLAPAPVAKQ